MKRATPFPRGAILASTAAGAVSAWQGMLPGPRSIVFISSVQKEFAAERRALKEFVHGDPLLRRFFEVFLFEDLPASGRRADEVYLGEVDRCTVYVGLFGNEYGYQDAAGTSPTEREFVRATAGHKERLVFVKGTNDQARHAGMQALIRTAGDQVIRRRFETIPELIAALYASLVEHLERVGDIRRLPFDAAACPRAKLDDLSPEKVADFLRRARSRRGYALDPDTPLFDALAHLNLFDRGQPSHAAVLLFGKEPQRFLLTSHVKCLHFHGTEVRKPIPSFQLYKGTVFELVDQAVDFVMSKIDRAVGTRAKSARAPETYELPHDAVAEAIVNAIAHRDYASNASVQVMLFADRLEVWNPGHLPPSLTVESLRLPHASVPHNPLIAEPLFLTRYIEHAGTGTLDMIALCAEAGLPAPEFRHDNGQFVQTLWRDTLTPAVLAGLHLNLRQTRALAHLRIHERITNAELQELADAPRRTAVRDLMGMVELGLLKPTGSGRGAAYVLRKRATNVPNVPSAVTAPKRAMNGPNAPAPKPDRKREARKHPRR
jgi:ATP-dependent DNA helicase RecG